MAYTLIDEKRNIWGCKLEDLSFDTAMKYSKLYGQTRTLKDLNGYVELDTGRIILNMDNSRFTQNKFNAISFLSKDRSEQDDIINRTDDNFLRFIRMAIREREAIKIKEITDYYCVWDSGYRPDQLVIDRLVASNSCAYSALYEYGYIQGKRAERARRKKARKQSEVNKKSPL